MIDNHIGNAIRLILVNVVPRLLRYLWISVLGSLGLKKLINPFQVKTRRPSHF